MRDPWFQAFFVTPPMICGVHLLPYSVAHDYILAQFGNPYVTQAAPPTVASVLELVSVCGRTWQENREAYLGTGRQRFLSGLPAWSRRWTKRMDFAVADASVKTYLADYTFVAEHHLPKTPADPTFGIAAPAHWHIVRCLCAHWHKTIEQAWNTAFGEAKCCFDVWTESQGDDTLESVADMYINELMREGARLYDAGDMDGMQAKYDEVKRVCDMRQEARKDKG